jgi:hypothetical protein
MNRRAFLRSACLIGCAPILVHAAAAPRTFSDINFRLELPEGYLDPIEHTQGASVSRGFRKPYAGTPLNTVILITVHDYGPSFAKRVPGERAQLTRETLDDIVAGIEKHRAEFRKSDPRRVTIAGYSGLKLDWSGSAQGIAFTGVVYCVLAGSRAYAVQIQDPSGKGDARLTEAVRAVERMRVAR